MCWGSEGRKYANVQPAPNPFEGRKRELKRIGTWSRMPECRRRATEGEEREFESKNRLPRKKRLWAEREERTSKKRTRLIIPTGAARAPSV